MLRRIQSLIQNLFGFSKHETNGFLVLSFILLIVILFPIFYDKNDSPEPLSDEDIERFEKALVKIKSWEENEATTEYPDQLFAFDPNVVSEKELKQLGLSDILSKRLINYRNSGGQFRTKQDLLKIYSMDTNWYQHVETYIQLKKPKTLVKKPNAKIDINLADSTELKSVHGIGPVLSARIVKYRNLLGGYVALEQLEEVYGMPAESLDALKKRVFISESFSPKQIDPNLDNYETLRRHPYISPEIARKIISIRSLDHGFDSLPELKKVVANKNYQKLKPYLHLSD